MKRWIGVAIGVLLVVVAAFVAVRVLHSEKPLALDPVDSEAFSSCPELTESRLAEQDLGFSGTLKVEESADESAWPVWVFTVDHWYSGGPAQQVTVRGSGVEMSYFAGTVNGEATQVRRYLVAGSTHPAGGIHEPGTDGTISACLTRPWSKERAEVYAKAFAGR